MKVAKDLVVSLAYQVRTEDGVLAVSYTHLILFAISKRPIT